MSKNQEKKPSEQQQAIIDMPTDKDVLVVAGAGSGKTFTMTARVVELINRGVAPEKILGLTFTRKAAAELLSRVSGAVGGTFMKPSVFTYDAFFQSIVRQYGLLVGFNQQTQPMSDAGAAQMISDILSEHIDELINNDIDLGSFAALVGKILALSENIAQSMIGKDCVTFEQAVERVHQWDQTFIERVDAMIGKQDIPQKKPSDKKKPKQRKKDSDKEYEKIVQQWQQEHDQYVHDIALYNADALRTIAKQREIILQFVTRFHEAKQAAHMAQYSDFTIAAYQLVTRFPSIGAKYRARFSHVLLDEYQDTSSTQAALIAALFHKSLTDRSAVSAVGDPFQSIYAWRGASPGAFRMFMDAYEMDQQRKPMPMTFTRRNSRVVLEAANTLTDRLRPREERIVQETETSKKTSAQVEEVSVPRLENIDGAVQGTLGVLEYDTFGQEVDGIVRFAKRAKQDAIARNEQRQHNGEKIHEPPYVAILFRTKTHMNEYRDALESAGLSTITVGTSALLEQPQIVDILAVLNVVADRTNSTALMRLLASPRFDVSGRDLETFARLVNQENTAMRFHALVEAGLAQEDEKNKAAVVKQYRETVPNMVFMNDIMLREDLAQLLETRGDAISAHGRNAIEQAGLIVRAVHEKMYYPLAQLVQCCIEALNMDIDLLVAGSMQNKGMLARVCLDSFLDVVNTYTQEMSSLQTPSLRGFLSWVNQLSQVNEYNDTPPDVPVDVVLSTVHQSKGLEWDSVAIVDVAQGIFPSATGEHLHVNSEGSGYTESATTWLEDCTAVPAPIRVDAAILPKFPSTATDDPVQSIHNIDDVETLDDEVFGTLRAYQQEHEGITKEDSSKWSLTQREEYGRRLHNDERRLMYVALTRAEHSALLTCARTTERTRDASLAPSTKKEPSIFLDEIVQTYDNSTEKITTPQHVDDCEVPCDFPTGFFIGTDAQEYMDAVVGDAWNTPLEHHALQGRAHWRPSLDQEMLERLRKYHDAINTRIAQYNDENTEDLQSMPMTASAQRLLANADLCASGTQSLEERAKRAILNSRVSVTAMQHMSKEKNDEIWRMIVRPIPHIASVEAQEGTQFHEWAQHFLTQRDITPVEAGNIWQERLATSRWAKRRVFCAEEDIVAGLRLQDGNVHIIPGKLDAVFEGGFDEHDASKQYTIIDWKTGHKPVKAQDIEQRLLQLDVYRLLFSKQHDVPLEAIDAALYYVSEPEARELRARDKTKEEILAQLSAGIPQIDDDE